MYRLQQWYGLADDALEDALYDSHALRDFVGIDLSRESVPDATTLLKFRHLLHANDLTRALFDEINAHLGQQGLLMRAGTIVDATTIGAPSSTKNGEGALKLQKARLISYARGHITVLDRPGLEKRSCGCYAVVKKEYDRLLPELEAT